MATKKKTSNGKIREKKSLVIDNFGDTVVIKNRSALGGGIFGAIIMLFCVMVAIKMREAWSSLLFWCIFAFIFLCSAYWFANAAFGKIVLNSPNKLMTVYSPFKFEYKFDEINYVEKKQAKPKDGFVVHTVCAYIGTGRKCVSIDTLSSEQADELEGLLKGMLDSGSMEYPEGNEEPFELEKTEKKGGLFEAIRNKLKKNPEPKAEENVVPQAEDSLATEEIAAVDECPVAEEPVAAEESEILDEEISFLTKESATPGKSGQEAKSEDELAQYEEHLIRRK